MEISDSPKSPKPNTKTAVISIAGEKTAIALRLYDEHKNLFTTYFPHQDFSPEGVSSGEGTGAKYIANFGGVRNNNGYISVSFLKSVKNLGQLRRFVNSQSGLIAANKWLLISRTQKNSYPWAKEKIVFRQGRDITGTLYLGQQKSKVLYVTTYCPVKYGDELAPRADLILRNLQVGS